MTKAIYPGSFDPITLGHLDIIRRIQPLFAELTIVVANSQAKKYLFTADERSALIRENLKGLTNVNVEIADGLTVDYASRTGARVIVRGLRAVSDFEYESAMASMNKTLKQDIETMIVFTAPQYSFVASTWVKEVAHYGGDLTKLIPPNVIEALKLKRKSSAV